MWNQTVEWLEFALAKGGTSYVPVMEYNIQTSMSNLVTSKKDFSLFLFTE